MNEQIEAIRKAAIAANPSILDLVFGCEIKAKHPSLPDEPVYRIFDITKGGGTKFYKYIHKEYRDWHDIGFMSVFSSTEDILRRQNEIIGRKIGIADVLLAIEESIADTDDVCVISSVGNIGVFDYSILPDTNFFDYYKQNINWKLDDDDLNRQSPECVAFIYELLK